MMLLQAIESLDISESLEITAMTSKEKERVPFDVAMQANGIVPAVSVLIYVPAHLHNTFPDQSPHHSFNS